MELEQVKAEANEKDMEVQSEMGTIQQQLKLNQQDAKGGKKSVVLPMKRKHSNVETKEQETQPKPQPTRFTRSRLQHSASATEQKTAAPEI